MRLWRITSIAFAVALVLVITHPLAAAAQIRILCSNGIKPVMQELVPQFEQLSAHQVFVAYSVAADLKRRIDAGESFDIAVLTPTLIDDAINQGDIASNTRIILARAPMAIAVRTGAANADISTIDAFKKTRHDGRRY
jgi:molybdate transport system substrate-binding protein